MSAATPEIEALVELDDGPIPPLAFGPPVAVIAAWTLAEVRPALDAVDAACRAGRWAVGYVAYEAAPAFDSALTVRPGRAGPLAWFGLHDAPLGPPPPGDDEARLVGLSPGIDAADHAAAVGRLRSQIGAGTAYQVNLTLRLTGRLEGDPLALYRRLRTAQGGGQTAFLRAGATTVISASPERFLARTGGRVTTRPMKGTARRGRWAEEDEAIGAALRGSEKDRAENVMIADLLRNDLGRVAEIGSVRAGPLWALERFRTVWQLTSTVEARVAPRVTMAELFAATFPCGSVTGAPKASAMRLIAAEEREPRGIYCGAVGAVAPGGDCAFNVAIRTVELDAASGEAVYGVGGGITWGSSGAAEWDEALAKAEVLALRHRPVTLLETMRLEGGRVALLDRHLARLSASARYHAIPLRAEWARRLVEAERGEARLRLLVDPFGRATLERGPLPASLDGPQPVDLCEEAVSSRDVTLFHKAADRTRYQAWRAARPDCFDVILRNEAGAPTESTIANLVVELSGERVTPPLGAGLLPGVFRADLLAKGLIRERPFGVVELARAGKRWLVNALRGWVEVELPRRP